jgi:hypothetical protein
VDIYQEREPNIYLLIMVNDHVLMHRFHSLILIIIGIGILFIPASGLSTNESSLITFSGQIVYEDGEGGYFGIVTDCGERYLPVNLPDQYTTPGLLIQGTGNEDDTIMTIQMWGQPLHIQTISLQNDVGLEEKPWYPVQEDTGTLQSKESEVRTDTLLMVAAALQNKLNTIDTNLKKSAEQIKDISNTTNLEYYLKSTLHPPSGVYEISVLDVSGTIIAVRPAEYEKSVGINISSVPYVSQILDYPVPVFSPHQYTIEEKNAIILHYPIFSTEGAHIGVISSLVDPAVMVEDAISHIPKETQGKIMVIQPDGTILYESDISQIGKSTWDDPQFNQNKSLLAVAARMQTALSGFDSYNSLPSQNGEFITRNIVWTSVGLHGSFWRVALIS